MEDDRQESAELRGVLGSADIDWLTPKEPYDEDDEPLWPAPVDPVELWTEPDRLWPHRVRSRPI